MNFLRGLCPYLRPRQRLSYRQFPASRERDHRPNMSMESSPQAIYRAEKDKALRERRITHLQLMQEAQEAFRKMLADAQLARKGGRPKSTTGPAAAAAAKKKLAATKSTTDAVQVTVTAATVVATPAVEAPRPAPTKRVTVKHAPAKKPAAVAKRHAAPAKASSRAPAKRSEPVRTLHRTSKTPAKSKTAGKSTRGRAASKRR
jgi:hypothetical protein